MVARLLRDDRDRQILALRQQVLIPQRRLATRPQLLRIERLALLLTSLGMKKQQALSSLMIVKPATIAGWHRQIVRRHCTFVPKRRTTEPPDSTRFGGDRSPHHNGRAIPPQRAAQEERDRLGRARVDYHSFLRTWQGGAAPLFRK